MSRQFLINLSIFLCACPPLYSQKDSSAKQLDEVVITATRYPLKQSRTGKVVIIITREQLEKNAGKTLGQVLNEQAGLIVNGALNAPGTVQSVYLRGAESGRTLITIDGMPVQDPSMISNEFDINLIPVECIERIEICKGAQSTLYGSDAVAGVINIITFRTDLQKPVGFKGSLAGGNYGTWRGNAQLYGKLAKGLLYNIRYGHGSSDGFSTARDSTGGKGNFDHDGYRGDCVTSNLQWNLNEQLAVKAFAQYSYYKNDLDLAAFTDGRDYTSSNRNLMLGTGFVYRLPVTTITGNYLYNSALRELQRDSMYSQIYYSDRYKGISQYAELFASTNLGSGFTLLNGADYRYASMNESGLAGTYPLGFKDTSVSQTSMYASLLFASDWGFNVELGGRLNTHSRYGSNFTYTFNPSLLIDKNWKLYASVASGFKAPSLYQLYANFYGNPSLQPEKSVNYEAGMQYSINTINLRLTYFNRSIRQGLDYNYFTNMYFNYDSQHCQGIEWEGSAALSKNISLTANYTWLHVRQEEQSRVSYQDTVYKYALRRPAHAANLSLQWRPDSRIQVNLTGHYESKRYDVGGYDVNFNPLPDVGLGSFLILNAYAEYIAMKSLKFFLEGRNITNKKFYTINGYNSIPAMFVGGLALNL
jgi:vitamin B12 transporter